MTSSKIADLNRVGFTWSVREGGHTAWDIRLMELKEYRDKMGNCNVPKIYPANPSLGYWVNEVRFYVCVCVAHHFEGAAHWSTHMNISRAFVL